MATDISTRLNWQSHVEEAVRRRKAEGLSQEALAALAGVTKPTVIRFERGEENVHLESALAILRALGIADTLPMKLWKLSPVDPGNLNWAASTWKEPATIRAPSERAARAAAALAFGMAAQRAPSGEIPSNPWRQEHLVRAEAVVDSRWVVDGPVSILEPTWGDHELDHDLYGRFIASKL
jgi:transcriptional regulator with XRE-family HTH domain